MRKTPTRVSYRAGNTTNLQPGGGGRRRFLSYPYPPRSFLGFWLTDPYPPVGFRLSVGTAAVPYGWTAEPLPPPPLTF